MCIDGLELESVAPETATPGADCVVIVTDHTAFDYARVLEQAALIVDTRNALRSFNSEKIVKL